MPKKIKIEAKDVDTAINNGLKEIGLRRDQVEVSVLARPTKGFWGIGAKPAVVEIRQKRWGGNLDAQIYMDVPKKRGGFNKRNNNRKKEDDFKRDPEGSRVNKKTSNNRGGKKNFGRKDKIRKQRPVSTEPKAPKENEAQLLPSQAIQNAVIPENLKAPMAEGKEMLFKMLEQMGIKTENLNVWWDSAQQRILLTFDCDHPAIVIGKEGKTLEAIQYLLTLSLSRHFSTPISVVADTQNYWRKSEDKLYAEIDRAVNAIKRGANVYRLKPMPAQMRRFIHRALETNEFVETASEGEGKWRKVVIKERVSTIEPKVVTEAEKAADAAARTPEKCASEQLDKEVDAAQENLDEQIKAERAAEKAARAQAQAATPVLDAADISAATQSPAGVEEEASSCSENVEINGEQVSICTVEVEKEEVVLKEAPSSQDQVEGTSCGMLEVELKPGGDVTEEVKEAEAEQTKEENKETPAP
ncbi:Single-stranded nucleic acid binding R3H domain protein [Elusimicrobium minutum Pei191]|uniref:RNA-binding protein KhpB n=1 Tax=Elusimicrobium minutum (strain Pei191) TaxID=445932 RepID=B2KE66_ELUMP|nr:RNA-binding cell elongation regulator Jag/EloR [Elusimicrobium minutum]ACC98812.1 Single-stranded nucleic acid binding R3H domain protein [Elusimicrobium minutum Pei191]